jgi:hypothetical protein
VIGVMPIGNCSAQLKVDTAGKTGLGFKHIIITLYQVLGIANPCLSLLRIITVNS